MTKNILSINEYILPDDYELVRNEKWFDYSVKKRSNGESVKDFEFRGPISDLFNALCNGNITLPSEIQLKKTANVVKPNFNRPVTPVLNTSVIQTVKTDIADAAHLAAASQVVPLQIVPKKETSSFEKEAPNESVLLNSPPKSYNGFYFPEFLPNFLNRIRAKRNIFIAGESGTGKSEMVQKLSDFYGQTLIRINFHQGVTESSLIGKYVVKNSETVFAYGLVPLAMKKGYWLLLDEIDYAEPEHTSVLQAILEGKPLVITSNEGEILKPHPSFRIFATGNTTGRGDSTDSYHGTNFMNSAFLDRWTIFEMGYSKKENKIIDAIIRDSEMSKKLTKIFELFRGLKKNGDITNAVFSTRRMMNIAEALKMGDSLKEAFDYELFSRFNSEENLILSECIRDILEPSYYLEKEWYLGNQHHNPMNTIQNQNEPTEIDED
jgi:cobaltochelatase CobS